MTVPVQTWGSMGTMVAEQHDFGTQTSEFLECNEVYDLFADLMRQVIINQPENPIKFLQAQLSSKPPLTVCVIGPPGINRSKYCQQIALDYNIEHIHVGKILRARKELKATIEAGVLVDDDIVIGEVKQMITKHQKKGWVLDGFPRTKVQAQALAMKETGFCLDKVLLLHTGEKAIRQRYAAKVAAAGFNIAEKEDLINNRLQQYQRHVISIAELFKNVIRQVEVSAGDDDQNVVYSIIKHNLHVRMTTNAPLRSHRICIVGPCSSGRSTQCAALAKNYGVVHVDLGKLLRKHQKDTGKQLEDVPPEYVSDEELCAVVGKRLNATDCLRKGWVLDGFPKTQGQAEFLRQAHLWPTRVIHLRVDEDTSTSRASTRQVDPVTATAYYRPPQKEIIRDRLVQAEHDVPEKIKERYHMHKANVDKVLHVFPQVALDVSGNEDIVTVTQALHEKIDTLLPSEEAQDAGEQN
uniref:Adenylate kinase n=1 Tax=Alexandrium andersonii TaxID=327968 RepID=A0A7S2IEI3_9DINO